MIDILDKDKVSVSVRLPSELLKRIDTERKKHKWSRSDFIRFAIRDMLDKSENDIFV